MLLYFNDLLHSGPRTFRLSCPCDTTRSVSRCVVRKHRQASAFRAMKVLALPASTVTSQPR